MQQKITDVFVMTSISGSWGQTLPAFLATLAFFSEELGKEEHKSFSKSVKICIFRIVKGCTEG
jgi:hypothetical protein